MEEEILEQQEQEIIEEPIVYMKVPNEQGAYIDKDGKRYDILTCRHTESREQVQVGTTVKEDEEGNEIKVPVYESRVVINKGWDSFNSLEQAMEAYGVEEYHETVIEEEVVVSNEENTTEEQGEVEE